MIKIRLTVLILRLRPILTILLYRHHLDRIVVIEESMTRDLAAKWYAFVSLQRDLSHTSILYNCYNIYITRIYED
jgi:hypothetical protein